MRADERFEAAYRLLLNEEERAQAGRFRWVRDRVGYVAAHALTRTMLSAHGGLPPRAWRFVKGPYGKPAVDPVLDRSWLRFNLSHTAGMAACAVARGCEVGVDVETIGPPERYEALAGTVFTPREIALIAAARGEDRKLVFPRLWTLKEAAIKALGMGLGLPLETFSMSLAPLGVTFHADVRGVPEAWSFAQAVVSPGHIVAGAVGWIGARFDLACIGKL